MTLEHGKVKNVISGDTLVVTFLGNPKLERTLSLAYVTAPRIRREGDEVRRPKLLVQDPKNTHQ